jgi:hypothetical protein
MKVPTKLVVYPNEGHLFLKPADFHDYTLRTLEWFDEWFTKASAHQRMARDMDNPHQTCGTSPQLKNVACISSDTDRQPLRSFP